MKVFGEEEQKVQIDLQSLAEDLSVNMDKLNHFDQWILQKISTLIADSQRAFSQFQLGEY